MPTVKSTDFSKYLFWDTDSTKVDLERNSPYMVQRVLEYGELSDWRLLQEYYGLKRIVKIAKQLRSLDPKALSFLCVVSNTHEEDYRCYSQMPLAMVH